MKKIYILILAFTSFIMASQTITIQSFATGFSGAVEITHAADSRLFVVQKGGLIKILNSDGTINLAPFLNVSSLISSGGERGLLGLAFHPNYTTNGYFFVNYTNTSGNTVIERYSVNSSNPNLANTTGSILMTIAQPYSNHNGGSIKFGPDGYLYIGMGDGGSGGDPENRAQNINENLGKLLRIDVDTAVSPFYTSPTSNPYIGTTGNDEIWAIGLRNPWKFSFNRSNGDLWIADVGQNNVEEINKVSNPLSAGLNFGWRCYEGTVAYNTTGCASVSTLTMPLAQYTHTGGNCSITGGYIYTGALYPNFLNKYFFADYCVNRIGYVDESSNAITYTPNFSGNNNFTSFGEDVNGELYITNSNTIFKIIDTATASATSFENGGFVMYPNPTKNTFTITNNNGIFTSSVQIFDASGKLLLTAELNQTETNTVDVSNFMNGIYLININAVNGQRYSSKLFVE
ncbi:PQQ-dependent sugar dehydrogenase [uncultured Flavobacterium sp.]|uniref:PQQ-dependent sugar dehydrogenase n=1 Tax=uncultured Flavobacterium sp. TaxID=165435 RepID=UPI0030CA1F3A|tara:strand:- start:390 stop:1766 length:1377 start_codon:yes stop_codon:yes gene_type:complete